MSFSTKRPLLPVRDPGRVKRQATMTYVVTFCSAHEEPRQIAPAVNFAEAVAAARKAGAVHVGEQVGRDFVFEVAGHEGDDDFAIWIEVSRR
jgi:hypothetical protein